LLQLRGSTPGFTAPCCVGSESSSLATRTHKKQLHNL